MDKPVNEGGNIEVNDGQMTLMIDAVIEAATNYERQYRERPEAFRDFFTAFNEGGASSNDFMSGFLLGFFDCAHAVEGEVKAGQRRAAFTVIEGGHG
jgi:hypothetical protein